MLNHKITLASLILILLIFFFPNQKLIPNTLSSDSTYISYDTYIDTSIDSLGEIDIYTFNGQSGDRIILRMSQYGTDPFDSMIELYGPSDTLLVSDWDRDPGHWIDQSDIVDFELPEIGIYIIYA